MLDILALGRCTVWTPVPPLAALLGPCEPRVPMQERGRGGERSLVWYRPGRQGAV